MRCIAGRYLWPFRWMPGGESHRMDLIQPFPFDMRIGRVVSHRKAKCGYHAVRFVFADEAVSLSDFRFHESSEG